MSGPVAGIERIVVGMDFSSTAERALAFACEFAQQVGAKHIAVVHAYYVPPEIAAYVPDRVPAYTDALSEQAHEQLKGCQKTLDAAGISSEVLAVRGSPAEVVARVASEQNADLVVIGSHGRTGFSRFALGSVAERVVARAPCAVITIKPEDAEQEEGS